MISVQKKIVAYHISRLQDKRKDVRLNAIAELEQLADADALEILQQLYQQDTDRDVRKAAQEAGRSIFRAVQARGTDQ